MAEKFADTFFFLAVANEYDAHHGAAVQFANSPTRIVTTEFVLLELADALASRLRESFATIRDRLLADRNVKVLPLEMALYEEAIALYAKRPDKEWSLTDCTSFVVMSRFGVSEALTGDHHFTQTGFVALFRQ